MNDIDLSPFLTLRRHLTIAHHIPGRIRLRIGASVFKELNGIDARLFDRILGAVPAIKDARVNAVAGSIVISYAPREIDTAWWDALINTDDTEATHLLRRLLDNEVAPAVAAARGE